MALLCWDQLSLILHSRLPQMASGVVALHVTVCAINKTINRDWLSDAAQEALSTTYESCVCVCVCVCGIVTGCVHKQHNCDCWLLDFVAT